MLTFFTTAKPFTGHSAIIQRNALKSWLLLAPDVEVILFGQDQGAAEVAAEFGLHHEPYVEQNANRTNRVDYLFLRAQQIARHHILCYANCDIILLPDFVRSLRRISARHRGFLMVGRRWDTEVRAPIDFSTPDWQPQLKQSAVSRDQLSPPWFIDYFAFTRGFYTPPIPPLLIGRAGWDNWMLWRAVQSGQVVIDATAAVFAIHQNHDYSHHPEGHQGVYRGPEAQFNLKLAADGKNVRTIDDAPYRLSRFGPIYLSPVPFKFAILKFYWKTRSQLVHQVWLPVWHFLLRLTRPLRNYLGLRKRSPETHKAQ